MEALSLCPGQYAVQGLFQWSYDVKPKSLNCYIVWSLTDPKWNFTYKNSAEYARRSGNMQMENNIKGCKKHLGSLTITLKNVL